MADSLHDRTSAMPVYPDMQGKVVLVTGGSSGIGLATAGAFARQGTKVVIASRRETAAKNALKQLATLGDAHWFPETAACGWKYWAIVQPAKAVGKMMIKDLSNKYARHGVTSQWFTDPRDAMWWLESQRATTQ